MVNEYSQSIEDKSNRLNNDISTDIRIVNDPSAVPYDKGNLTIYVKNIGRITLNNNSLVILIDGNNVNITQFSTTEGLPWYTGITAEVKVSVPEINLLSDHKLKAIVQQGNSDSIIFRIHSLSDMKFENDPALVPYSHPVLTLYIRNTGERVMEPGEMEIMIDGSYETIDSVDVNDGNWDPGELAVIMVNTSGLRQDRTHDARIEIQEISEDLNDFRIEERFSYKITNDPDSVPYNNSNLSFYIQNSGNEEISVSSMRVLVNGPLKDIVSSNVVEGGNWVPGNTINLTVHVENLNNTELHSVRINGPQGTTETMDFHVRDEE